MLAVLAVSIFAAVSAGPAAAAYELVGSWEADHPQPIALDAAGNLLVGSNAPGNPHVTIYSPGGQQLAAFGSPSGFDTIAGIAVDAQSRVYVTDIDGLQIFSEQGQRLDGASIEVEGETVAPFGIDIDARGDQYLTYSESGDVGPGVLRFSATAQPLAGWGEAGAGPGQFSGPPLGVASNGRGDVYVSDLNNDRIQRFSDTGTFIAQWGQRGSAPGQFFGPGGVALDPAGNVFVADEGNGRVQIFDPTGRFLDQITIRDGVAHPRNVAVAADGTVYVTESALLGQSIYVFRPVPPPPPPAPPASPAPPAPPTAGKPQSKGAAGVTIASKTLRYHKGKISVGVKCTATTPCRGSVRLLAGKTLLGARKYKLKPATTATIAVKLTARGRRALGRAPGKKITVNLVPTDGKGVIKKLAV